MKAKFMKVAINYAACNTTPCIGMSFVLRFYYCEAKLMDFSARCKLVLSYFDVFIIIFSSFFFDTLQTLQEDSEWVAVFCYF